jgi:NAD(P)H-nitrite reductase large subunit
MKIVIVGSGMAGVGLALALRKAAPAFEVTLLTTEQGGHYSRPLLSHGLAREDMEQRIVLKSFAQIVNEGVSIVSGIQVTRIDREARRVYFKNPSDMDEASREYDRLVLATGSEAFVPPPWLEQRAAFWTLNQLEDLRELRNLRKALIGQGRVPKWVIVGGGLIGCEVASDLRKAGDEVHLVHAMSRLMERQLDETQSENLRQHFLSQGIRISLDRKITTFAELNAEADLILVATGFRPRIQLAQEAGLKVAQGIITDEFLRTDDPNIFALGDVAQINGERTYAFVAPIRDQVSWLAGFLSGQMAEPWKVPVFKPVAKIHGFRT